MSNPGRPDSPWLHKLPRARTGKKRHPNAQKFRGEAEACIQRPGVWLLLMPQVRNVYMLADKVRAGRYVSFRPKGDWRAAVRNSHGVRQEDGRKVWTGDLYVCYDPRPLTPDQLESDTEFPADADPWELMFKNKPNNKQK